MDGSDAVTVDDSAEPLEVDAEDVINKSMDATANGRGAEIRL